jgi:ribosomal protein S18 acetylase RimI-like enzyme
MTSRHARGAAEMHLLAFRGFFLASLGRGFLRELYRQAAAQEQTVGYVVLDDKDDVVGALFGLTEQSGFYRAMFRRRWWAFAFHSAGALLRRPWILPRLVRARSRSSNPPPFDLRPLGSIESVAVDPRYQGKGLGAALLRAASEEFVRRGVHAIYLTTDADRNDKVRAFYKSQGWRFQGYFTTPEGRRMCWYLWLDPAATWPAEALREVQE